LKGNFLVPFFYKINEMNLEIKPGKGLGKVLFGMTREQVREILGLPDEIEKETEDGISVEHWHYDQHEISLLFSGADSWRLLSFAVGNPLCTIEGEKLIDLNETQLHDALERMGISEDLEYEDFSSEEFPDHIMVYCEELGVNFWLDNGIVSEIQCGPFMKDDETVDWPE
jgi:hypothetical protein